MKSSVFAMLRRDKLCFCASVLITTVLLATSLFAGHYETVNKLFLIDKYHQEMKLADARRDVTRRER